MRLLRLEITGFKSFEKKTVIEFVDGITAIVGPNGSGKSNIADAIRWVLGEQSAKALRGTRMEDVIFNGTEQRKPLGYCEVTLVFDNSDGKLASDYTEVSITRRVYRSNEGEYLINSRQCRLKDIQELFRDTGIGKEGYSIIGQGRVEEILSNKSSERRAIFEEAAGVMRFRSRKEEAERKLANTRDNLVRIRDIIAELEDRLVPLETQSADARKYLLMRDELKSAELNLYLIQHDRLNERINATNQVIEQLYNEQLDAEVQSEQISSQCASLEESERTQNATINELQNKLIGLTSTIEGHAGETKVLNERLLNARCERERLMLASEDDESALEALFAKIDELSLRLLQINDSLVQLQDSVDTQDKDYRLKTELIDSMQEKLDEQKSMLIASLGKMSDAKSDLARIETMKDALEARKGELEKAVQEQNAELSKLECEKADAVAELDELLCDIHSENVKATTLLNERERVKKVLDAVDAEIADFERKISSGQSRERVLTEMKEAHEGFYTSVRNIMRDAANDVALRSAIEGVVAELISVPEQFEVAIEMALGSALQNIVTKTEEDAKYVIEQLRRRNYGRATFLPLSLVRPRTLNENERAVTRTPGCFGVADELISYDNKYRNAVSNLLGRTIIVRDVDIGIAINKRVGGTLRIATLQGDIINQGGSITGGSVQKREFSLLGRERELNQLSESIKEIRTSAGKLVDSRVQLQRSIADYDTNILQIKAVIHDMDVEKARRQEKIDTLVKLYDEANADLDETKSELSRVIDNIEDTRTSYDHSEQMRDDMEHERQITVADISRLQKELYAMRQNHSSENERLTVLHVELASSRKEASSTTSEISRLNNEIERIKKKQQTDRKRLIELDGIEGRLLEKLASMDNTVLEGRQEAENLNEEIRRLGDELDKHRHHLDEVRLSRSGIQQHLESVRERISKAQLQLSKATSELEAAQDRIWRDYSMTLENILPYRRDVSASAEHLKIDELRKQIRALGEVNVSSIDEYKLVKNRYDAMVTQSADLEKAEVDLQELIGEILLNMQNQFRTQFEAIQRNFAEVFSELFRGGNAELVLSDKEDILNCDIDIIAQPPGKKLQLLSLLSGGERALTAIALLFAILKLKPTAFCVLDEIEAALDEVNVSNYAEYLVKYSKETQFILITHRKGSMAVCNALYGVAMEEKGVSKIASAKFENVG